MSQARAIYVALVVLGLLSLFVRRPLWVRELFVWVLVLTGLYCVFALNAVNGRLTLSFYEANGGTWTQELANASLLVWESISGFHIVLAIVVVFLAAHAVRSVRLMRESNKEGNGA